MEKIPSIRELRRLCQSTAPNPARESYVGKFARIFSIYSTRFFILTPFTPNQITFLSVIVFFTGVTLIGFGGYTLGWFGIFLLFLSIVIDGSDGEVARFKKNGSVAGTMYVEPVSHDLQYGLMFPLLGIGLYVNGYPAYILAIASLASISKLLFRILKTRYWSYANGTLSEEGVEKLKSAFNNQVLYIRVAHWINKEFFSSTGVFLLILICYPLRRLDVYLWIYCLGFTVVTCALLTKHIHALWVSKTI